MSTNRHRHTWALMLVAAIAIGSIGGHSAVGAQGKSAPAKAKKGKEAAPEGPRVWPLPPDQPRIRYVTSYQGVGDFKKKGSKWKTLLLGDDPSFSSPDTLVKPYGVAVSSRGRIYVADTADRRVFVFDPEARALTFLGDSGPGRLTKPIGVAVDGQDRVFVADGTVKRVFGYATDGSLAVAIGHEGELQNPSGLAIDRTRGLLYVADAQKHQVLCYSTTDGSPVRTIGRRGTEPGEFNFPTNLFVDQAGRLYVADTLNFRIQVFDTDGGLVKAFGELGDMPGTFNRPKGVAVDSEGHIYVADATFNNFQIFDADGQLLLFVGQAGRGIGDFLLPAGLFIDQADRIYVADQGNGRVQVFQYVKASGK